MTDISTAANTTKGQKFSTNIIMLSHIDALVLAVILLGSIGYFAKRTYRGFDKFRRYKALSQANISSAVDSRDIISKMNETGINCVVFYGSQTGTAEEYARRLVQEGRSRFGLKAMVADMGDYDYDNLDTFPSGKIAIFVLATYGEGQPTDNAVDFYNSIIETDLASRSEQQPLKGLQYVAFGLGNSTYDNYNVVVCNVDNALQKLGAHRIHKVGQGDNGTGTAEEDFMTWKESMWAAVATAMNLTEAEATYQPMFRVSQSKELFHVSPCVYSNETNQTLLETATNNTFNSQTPHTAPMIRSYELFSAGDRNCLHIDLDISDSSLFYRTGDHVAVWPSNSDDEVDRLLRVLHLCDNRYQGIQIESLEPAVKVPFPTPITYDTIFRHYSEICAPVSRQLLSALARFSPNKVAKDEIVRLGDDKEYFHEQVGTKFLNLGRLLEHLSNGEKWPQIPFSLIVESLGKLQPRYYSISSSSLLQPHRLSITAVVEKKQNVGSNYPFRGVATGYLSDLKRKQNSEICGDSHTTGNIPNAIKVPIHIRHSSFKLPSDPSVPIIMIGPGTGVAPFRAFVQERAEQARRGLNVGKAILFFGCRKPEEDFIYQSEWESYQKSLGDRFELITAFSRQGSDKIYVQHRLEEQSKKIGELIQQGAFVYICGDAAHMAREVNVVLAQIIASSHDVDETEGRKLLKTMKSTNRFQEDVWA
ncbi:unnamed protein product [Clonostachys rosea]|uniref:NADPH--cytochrome P450 reductase n=1 Tax=Bionectria ochroleuca TaxID=29856 RepID=A0ABY6TZD4_BIOOC|nr:unnamed protein product [Clonostachys rosea]